MKRFLAFSLLQIMQFFLVSLVFADPSNTFDVAQGTPVQAMVVGSSQGIHYTLSSSAPQNAPVVVTCSFTATNPSLLSASFNDAGCANGGVGIYSGNPVDTLVTLTLSGNATTTQTGTLVFKQKDGRGYPVTKNISITVEPNSQRVITINNYCVSPNGAGNSTGNDIVIGVITSATPAASKYTANTACTSDSECHALSIYSTCVGLNADGACPGGSCYCGGGACTTDTDCVNSSTGTCSTATNQCTYCASDSDCLTGSSCNTSSNTCYFNFPTPSKYQLSAYTLGGTPDSATITLTDNTVATGFTQVFNGRFSARVGCTLASGQYSSCNVADCQASGTSGSGACNFSHNAFSSPYGLAEFTLIGLTPDTYDISLESGSTVPMAMYPTPGNPSSPGSPNDYSNPYLCGIPGATTEVQTNSGQQNIGASPWTFTLPTYSSSTIYQLRWVDGSDSTACHSDTTCQNISANYYCGMTKTNETSTGATTCGKLLGYWSFDQICTDTAGSFTFRSGDGQTGTSITTCATDYPATGTSNTYTQLLACSGNAATSCFNVSSSNTSCCGCVNWQTLGITVPTDGTIVPQCTYPNAYWVGSTKLSAPGVLPFVTWTKQGCTSCYSYPYDDKTSTFTCPGNTGQSGVDYTIDLCPENKGLQPA